MATVNADFTTFPAWAAWPAQDKCGPAGSAYARWIIAPESEGEHAGLWLVCEGMDFVGPEGRDWLTKRRPTDDEIQLFHNRTLNLWPAPTKSWDTEKRQDRFRRACVVELGAFGAACRQVAG